MSESQPVRLGWRLIKGHASAPCSSKQVWSEVNWISSRDLFEINCSCPEFVLIWATRGHLLQINEALAGTSWNLGRPCVVLMARGEPQLVWSPQTLPITFMSSLFIMPLISQKARSTRNLREKRFTRQSDEKWEEEESCLIIKAGTHFSTVMRTLSILSFITVSVLAITEKQCA